MTGRPPAATPRPDSRGATAGFTLLELLVSLTLLSFVLAALFGGIRFVGRVRERGMDSLAQETTVDATRALLSRQTARLFPVAAGEAKEPRFLFTGRDNRLGFPVLEPPGHGPAGLFLAVFDIEPMVVGSRLVYRQYAFVPGATVAVADAPLRSSVVAVVPFRLSFSYRGDEGAKKGPGWVRSWDIPDELPRLVRLSASDGADWPALVARLRVTGDSGCGSGDPKMPCRARNAAARTQP